MCRQTFATEGSRRTPVRFILPSIPGPGNRPSPAHLSHILFAFHFRFSAAVKNLRWRLIVPGQRPTTRSGRTMLRAGIEALGSGALLPETRSFDGKFDAVGAIC